MGKDVRAILEYTCDQCGKTSTPDDIDSYYIMNPYGPELNIAPDRGALAFCSIECCCDYIKRVYGQYVNMIKLSSIGTASSHDSL